MLLSKQNVYHKTLKTKANLKIRAACYRINTGVISNFNEAINARQR
jgi:hypothetical protein